MLPVLLVFLFASVLISDPRVIFPSPRVVSLLTFNRWPLPFNPSFYFSARPTDTSALRSSSISHTFCFDPRVTCYISSASCKPSSGFDVLPGSLPLDNGSLFCSERHVYFVNPPVNQSVRYLLSQRVH